MDFDIRDLINLAEYGMAVDKTTLKMHNLKGEYMGKTFYECKCDLIEFKRNRNTSNYIMHFANDQFLITLHFSEEDTEALLRDCDLIP